VQADFGVTMGRSMAISIYGSTSSENLFLIDGVNTTNVVRGIQGKDINNEFIQEVEVKTGGYQAEYGRNTGGVINVITKSGGNDFHGGVFGYFNDTGTRADVTDEFATPQYSRTGDAQFSNYKLSKDVRQEWGADLGGFVVKDTVWFFGAYDRVNVNQNLETLDLQNSATFGVEFPRSSVQSKFAGKLTLNLAQGTSLVGSVFADPETQLGALAQPPLSLNKPTYAGQREMGGTDYGARFNQLFGAFGIVTLQYAQHSDRFATIPEDRDLSQIRDYTVSPNGVSYVPYGGFGPVFGYANNNQSKRELFSGSFASYLGNHEIKAGGDYSNDSTSGTTYITGGQRVRIRPCLQSGANICDLSQAPFYTNGQGQTRQVFYQHEFLAAGTVNDFQIIDASPFTTPTKRYSAYIQDQWSVIPSLTVNVGVRWDQENFYGMEPDGTRFSAFGMGNQWAPRLGVVWDWTGDGTSKLYASVGRFYYALPTDLNIRVFTANSAVNNYNYDFSSGDQDPSPKCTATVTTGCTPRLVAFQGGDAHGEPVDAGTKAAYQDELSLGVEKALDPTFSVGLKGTYRSLGRTVEDRCDLNSDTSVDANGDRVCPDCAPASCALFNPGGTGPAATGYYPTCNGSNNPVDPDAGNCSNVADTGVPVGASKRYFRGIELTARKQFTNALWAQGSFLYSSLSGNYSGAIREASGQTDPGINADYDYYQFAVNANGTLELDRPVQARLDAVYNAPFGLAAGLGFYVRSGLPISKLGFFNSPYPNLLYLDTRGSNGRTPTDYDLNLSLSYSANVGPVMITPMLYFFNLLNRQTPFRLDSTFNPNGAFVTDPSSPFYGQAGIQPGTDNCPAAAPAPCSDNPDYRKVNGRTGARLLRAAIKITF
jgi:hypothetical protein